MEFNHVFDFKFKRLITVFTLFLAFSVTKAQSTSVDSAANESTSVAVHEDEPFEPTKVIMEHISDSHGWHLWGETSIPLPVILYTPQGLEVFSSAQFHHGKHNYKGAHYTYCLTENKIKVVADDNKSIDETASAAIIDLSITKNVAAMFVSFALLFFVFTGVAKVYKKREGKSPKGFQSLIEPIILFIRDDIAKPNIGHKYTRFMPYLLTVFFFIWVNNMLGLVPIFPGGANVTGNIALTFVLSLGTLILVNINGNKYYWKHILTPDVPWWLYPIMIPVELIGVLSKPFALMIRLFANITAGHIIVLSLISLIFIFKTMAIAPVSVAFVLFMDVLELLVAFLQAFIFTLLTALFIGMAVEEHH